MARKTYHHLTAGETVAVEHYRWTSDGGERVMETVDGEVTKVLKSRVEIRFAWITDKGRAITWQQFSRQGGQRWGAEEDDYRISPKHAQVKA